MASNRYSGQSFREIEILKHFGAGKAWLAGGVGASSLWACVRATWIGCRGFGGPPARLSRMR